MGGDVAFALLEACEAGGGGDCGGAEALDHSIIKQLLEAAAMDGELGDGIASLKAAKLAPDLLAETVEIDQFAGADAGFFKRWQKV